MSDETFSRSVRIERPIIIAGLPRSGTTHLHNLIAADPAIRSLPYWESLEPFPAPDEPGEQSRRDRCAVGLDMVETSMPYFKRMHEMTVDHAHEEIQLLANDISGMLFETTYYIPSFGAHYKATDQHASYEYFKRSRRIRSGSRRGSVHIPRRRKWPTSQATQFRAQSRGKARIPCE